MVSGTHGYSFAQFAHSDAAAGGGAWLPQLLEEHVDRIPDAVIAAARAVEVHTFMGLLPDVGRAFVAVDNVLHLWRYEGGGCARAPGLARVRGPYM